MPSPLDSSTRSLTEGGSSGAPRLPSPLARRLIFGLGGSGGVVLFIGAVFVAVGSLSTLIFAWDLPLDVLLAVHSVPSEARVVSADLDTSVEINDEHPTRLQYTYSVTGRAFTGGSSTLDTDVIARAQPGALVDIEYVPSSPQWSRVRGTTHSTLGYYGFFVLLFPLVGAALVAFPLRAAKRRRRAYSYGTPIAAELASFGEDTSTEVNGRHPWELTWRFNVHGIDYTGKLSSMKKEDLAPFAQSEQLTVLYLPDDPSVNTLFIP